MQSQCLDSLRNLKTLGPSLGFGRQNHSFVPNSLLFASNQRVSRVLCCSENRRPRNRDNKKRNNGVVGRGEPVRVKEKESVLNYDSQSEKFGERRRRGRKLKKVPKKAIENALIVSAAMLVEIETVLQTQEPVIIPLWNTFASSVCGIWKGVGAVFSPTTAEMEPIGIGSQHENFYDCYTLSYIKQVPASSNGLNSQLQRKINGVALNPYGEVKEQTMGNDSVTDIAKVGDSFSASKDAFDETDTGQSLPRYESFDFTTSEILEEDVMGMEPGLVFFEDGSYSRGPVNISVGDIDESKSSLSPSFQFEQCLVKGCHKRLRIVHTIEFNEGGSNVKIIKVAVYEEQWVGPTSLLEGSDVKFDLKPFSQRRRTQLSELIGSWKVFEVSATPIFGEELTVDESKLPYVYFCVETLKKRSLPEHSVHFGEEEMLDMQDVTVLWLPGGITGYVDVQKDGVLCIGVGWYSDEGINLVMERDYGIDGELKEVRWKTEVKRRWADHPINV